jgi:Phosphoenolpyruvate synthase/pyruvate phosphate dikinase
MPILTDYEAIARSPFGKAAGLAALSSFCEVPPFLLVHTWNYDEVNELAEALEARFSADTLFAVRSSADVEDSGQGSFAGLFETRLGVSRSDVPSAIASVLESASASRVTQYQKARGLSTRPIVMGVVIQEMVPADVAGVALSSRPGLKDCLVVEAVFGLGEGLVSGSYTPDTYYVARDSGAVTVAAIGYQPLKLVLTGPGPPTEIEVFGPDRKTRKLLPNEVIAVSGTLLEVERHFESLHIDMEWAIVGDTIFALQARPLLT